MADGFNVKVLDAGEPQMPTEEEIRDYAVYLGIDADKEPNLMWIARQGVVAPVPPPWKACHNMDADCEDEVFYFNFETSESIWDHPCDEQYRQLVISEREKAKKEAEQKAAPKPVAAASAGAASEQARATGSTSTVPDVRALGKGGGKSSTSAGSYRQIVTDHDSDEDEELTSSLSSRSRTGEDNSILARSQQRLETIQDSESEDSFNSTDDRLLQTLGQPGATIPKYEVYSRPSFPARDRGSLGVGLAAARELVAAVTAATEDESISESLEQDVSGVSAGRGVPSGSSPSQLRERRDQRDERELSGKTGKSGSSAASEISEEFLPSEAENASPVHGMAGLNTQVGFGDTFELSATGDGDDVAAAMAAATERMRSGSKEAGLKFTPPSRLDENEQVLADPNTRSRPKGQPKPLRECAASLSRTLAALKDIRQMQQEYLRLLQTSA